MNKTLLVLNVILLVAVGYLFYLQFGTKQSGQVQIKSSVNDAVVPGNTFRIAYFEMDSIEKNFEMVKDVKTELNKREDLMNSEVEVLDNSYRDKVNQYQSKATTMSQTQSEQATQDLMKMQEDVKNRKQALFQEYNDFKARQTAEIQNKIKEFLQEYNKTKGYNYIASDDPGLFYFKDSSYNITPDVINGLNVLYKKTKKN